MIFTAIQTVAYRVHNPRGLLLRLRARDQALMAAVSTVRAQIIVMRFTCRSNWTPRSLNTSKSIRCCRQVW